MSTDDDKKLRAQKLLLELLGESQGLPTKIGQFLSMKEEGDGLQKALDASINPMPFEEVVDILNSEYEGDYHSVFRNVKPQARPASLGQVHPGTLKNGQPVAIKIQYPEIEEKVEAELKLLGWIPGMGPVKKWGIDLAGYVGELREHLGQELDYNNEASQQIGYRDKLGGCSDVVVPKVYSEFSNKKILVQSFEKGEPFEKVINLPQDKRQEIGKIWVSHILFMLFQKGVMHSDPNPQNFAFRIKGRKPAMVLYDFGSLFEVTENERMLLVKIILAIRSRENVDPAQCLEGLGFDLDKLHDIRHCLPGLLSVLFEPFIQNDPFDLDGWEINRRWDDIVGDLKWWFRSAAPPRIIFLMRTFHGLASHLRKLKVSVSWSRLLDEIAGDLFRKAREWPLPESDIKEEMIHFGGLSRFLKIDVRKGEGNRVELTMPARVVESLEEVIDPPVLESIRKQNIDLKNILKKVQRSGFQAQVLFEIEDSVRKVKVWLE